MFRPTEVTAPRALPRPGRRARTGLVAGCVLATLLAGCADTTLDTDPARSTAATRTYMTQAQLLATLPGHTASGVAKQDGNSPWTQTYSPANGKTRGTFRGFFGGNEPYTGTWVVDGAQWCEDWITDSACYTMEQAGPNSIRVFEDGQPLKNLWTIE